MIRAVLWTGSRHWTGTTEERAYISNRMTMYPTGTVMIHGGCQGVDMLVEEIANQLSYPTCVCNYFGYAGKAGGPIRNEFMVALLRGLRMQNYETAVEVVHDDLEHSSGTANCNKKALRAGFKPTYGPE